MNSAWRYVVLATLLAYSLPSSSQDAVKILFIGSSYFNYNNLPELFEPLSRQSGKELYIDQHMIQDWIRKKPYTSGKWLLK
jgi:hypothetical protein